MFREIIAARFAAEKYSYRAVSLGSGVDKTCLNLYILGKPAIGLKSVEALNKFFGINVVNAETGEFFYHGYDIREAVKRGMTEQHVLVKDICEAADIKQPNVTEYLQGRSYVRPVKAELMLARLGLTVAYVPTPDRIPRLKTGKRLTFKIGADIRAAIEKKEMSPFKFAKENGFNNFAAFLDYGKLISPDRVERMLGLLDITITDGETDYGTDIRKAIQAARKKRKVTYRELGEVAGCSTLMVSFYLTGRNDTSIKKVDAMFTHLGLSLKY